MNLPIYASNVFNHIKVEGLSKIAQFFARRNKTSRKEVAKYDYPAASVSKEY